MNADPANWSSSCLSNSNGGRLRSEATACLPLWGLYSGKDFANARAFVQFNKRNATLLVVRSQTTNEPPHERLWSPLGVDHEIGEIVANKYRVVGVLGQGGVGTTYEVETDDGSKVALKAMSLRNMKVWKDLVLFEREARVLRSLKHPSIPEYIDYFEVDSPSDRAFYIAQKVAKGRSLEHLLGSGWRVTEDEVIRIALEILEVLKYLGSLRPPVVHRDIKVIGDPRAISTLDSSAQELKCRNRLADIEPANVILDKDTGIIKVVDFGAVQDAASVTLIGSTVVGTYGYMAPEQFQNRATLQTDLYGLGGTLLFLLSGRSPSSFPQKRLKVDFNSVTVSPRLASIIDKLLEPAPEDRFQSPLMVINALKSVHEPLVGSGLSIAKGQSTVHKQQDIKRLQRPAGTNVALKRDENSLEITIPPVGLTMETAGTGTFTIAWTAFLTLWTRTAFTQGAAFGALALFSLPFWFVGIRLARDTLSKLTVSVTLKLEGQRFAIEWQVGNIWKHQVVGNTRDITSAEVFVEGRLNRHPITACRLVEGVRVYKFGSGLEQVEKKWIVQELTSFLGLPEQDPFAITFSHVGRRDTQVQEDPWEDEDNYWD